jgi:CYTH domain-containing protein
MLIRSQKGPIMQTARRFLLDPSLARLICREFSVDRQIIEGYLSAQPGRNQFVRSEADQFHLVLPLLGPAGEPMDEPAPIPQAQAELLFELSVGQISYTRLCLPVQSTVSHQVLLDLIIYPERCGILTVEFDDQQQAEAFRPAPWFGLEVTGEDTYEPRYIALNGLPARPEMPLLSLQLEAVLDMLDQAKQAPEAAYRSTAHEVVVALSRSLETSGMLKGMSETTALSGEERTAEQFEQPMKSLAQ